MGIEAALIGAGANLIGSSIASRSASKAAQTAANAQQRAAQQAAASSAFRPVGVTTRFGQSQFTMGTDQYGNPIVTGAGYTASPEIQALQNRLSALYGQNLGLADAAAPVAQGLFGLGQQYIAESPEAARQRVFNELQAARLPAQVQEEQRLASGVFGRGRAGLSVSGIGQPELYTLARAREAQRAADVAAAQQQAQQQTTFGVGLLGEGLKLPTAALAPFQSTFGTAQSLEEAAMQPLALGAQIGGRNVNPVGAQALLQGGLGAAQTQYGASLARIAGQQTAGQNLMNTFMNQLFPQQQQAPAPIYDASVSYVPSMFEQNAGLNFLAPSVYG